MRVRAALFEAPGAPLVVRTIDLEGPGPGRRARAHRRGRHLRLRPARRQGRMGAAEADGARPRGRRRRRGRGRGRRATSPSATASILSWAPACGECGPCLAGRTTACLPLRAGIGAGTLPDGTTRLSADGETIYRMTAVGALAERVVMPASGVLKLTHELPAAEAALLGCAALTGIGAAREVAAGDVGRRDRRRRRGPVLRAGRAPARRLRDRRRRPAAGAPLARARRRRDARLRSRRPDRSARRRSRPTAPTARSRPSARRRRPPPRSRASAPAAARRSSACRPPARGSTSTRRSSRTARRC